MGKKFGEEKRRRLEKSKVSRRKVGKDKIRRRGEVWENIQ